MARLPRFDLPGFAQHVVQRGNNRMPCFLDDDDRRRYLHGLHECLRRYECQLHAYVLMTNHIHLLMTPSVPGAVSRLMQTFGRNYARLFNARHQRSGTLWEGRFKSCLVDSDRYVLRCYRYIELNPVRAWMVAHAKDHPWSSYAANALGASDERLAPHPAYMALGADPDARIEAYRALVDELAPDEELAEIRSCLQQQRALGDSSFQRRVERETSRYAAIRPAHRPRKLL
jgi:putative transposase